MKTNNQRAPEVANEIGARCEWIAGEQMFSLDCSDADFSEMLEIIEEEGPSSNPKFNYAAYNKLQNEGCSEKHGSREPSDEFDTGRE